MHCTAKKGGGGAPGFLPHPDISSCSACVKTLLEKRPPWAGGWMSSSPLPGRAWTPPTSCCENTTYPQQVRASAQHLGTLHRCLQRPAYLSHVLREEGPVSNADTVELSLRYGLADGGHRGNSFFEHMKILLVSDGRATCNVRVEAAGAATRLYVTRKQREILLALNIFHRLEKQQIGALLCAFASFFSKEWNVPPSYSTHKICQSRIFRGSHETQRYVQLPY